MEIEAEAASIVSESQCGLSHVSEGTECRGRFPHVFCHGPDFLYKKARSNSIALGENPQIHHSPANMTVFCNALMLRHIFRHVARNSNDIRIVGRTDGILEINVRNRQSVSTGHV